MVGNELENSDSAYSENYFLKLILGHEIENHSYSHPFGLAALNDSEIQFYLK
jgi:hypothetical protein